ncbi:MAG: CHAT domain-containing protein [Vulcanococcus sp.]
MLRTASLDLLLLPLQGPDPATAAVDGSRLLQAVLISEAGPQPFVVPWPLRLEQAHRAWRQRWLCQLPDGDSSRPPAASSATAVPRTVLERYALQLQNELQSWCNDPAWQPLQLALQHHPQRPLRLSLQGLPAWLESLPWEVGILSIRASGPWAAPPSATVARPGRTPASDPACSLESPWWDPGEKSPSLPPRRPVWLLTPGPTRAPRRRPPRQPRVLLLVGREEGLSLEQELRQLQALQARGRITLQTLRRPGERPTPAGTDSTLESLRSALRHPRGWDVLVYLGHSQADAGDGGRLQLGDGSVLTGDLLRQALEEAADRRPDLVLFSSCSGLDLARSAIAAGVDWAVSFREPVPCAAASLAFTQVLQALERGVDLATALDQARDVLQQQGPPTSQLLPALLGNAQVPPLRLPLRHHRQLALRLRHSHPGQAIATTALLTVAAISALAPWNPVSTYLLDRRLWLQYQWRLETNQPGWPPPPSRLSHRSSDGSGELHATASQSAPSSAGASPSAEPLAVLLIDPSRTQVEFGVAPTPGRLPRATLVEILRRLPAQQVPQVALDVVLDRPDRHDPELAAVLRTQLRPRVISGCFGPEAAVKGAGSLSCQLSPALQASGLQPHLLDVNTPGSTRVAAPQPIPLRLQAALHGDHFAAALSDRPEPLLPADAVIDWSLPWTALIRRIEPAELPTLRTRLLLVGSTGEVEAAHPDLFRAPGAAAMELATLSGGSRREVPGALVQAALAQTLRHRLALHPLPQVPLTALAALAGVLLAAALPSRRSRLLPLLVFTGLAVPLGLQLAVSLRLLLPLLLPLSALWSTSLLRRD